MVARPKAGSMLDQRRRRWTGIGPAWGHCHRRDTALMANNSNFFTFEVNC